MKTMKKTVGKKPMMKAKKGMSVKDPGDGIKNLSQKLAAGFSTGVAALSAAVEARRQKKAKQEQARRDADIKTQNLQKVEKENKNSTLKELEDMGTGYQRKGGVTGSAKPKAKYGATVKSKSAKPKAMYGTSVKPKMMEKGGIAKAKYGRGVVSTADGSYTRAGKKIGSGMGKSAEYRDFTSGEGDRSYGSMAEKMKLRKENKKASASGKIQVQRKGGAVRKSKPKK